MMLLTVHVYGKPHAINLDAVQVISARPDGKAAFDFEYSATSNVLFADESFEDVMRTIAAVLGHHAPPFPIHRLGGAS